MPPLVLIAEDDADVAEAMAVALSQAGFRSVLAADGAEAVDLFFLYRPAAALLDLSMPKLDGLEVARRIRALPEGQHTPVASVTGSEEPALERAAKEAGSDRFFRKPLDLAALVGFFRSRLAIP